MKKRLFYLPPWALAAGSGFADRCTSNLRSRRSRIANPLDAAGAF
jgi:hypothetical protein